jgi:hypothetical protein
VAIWAVGRKKEKKKEGEEREGGPRVADGLRGKKRKREVGRAAGKERRLD